MISKQNSDIVFVIGSIENVKNAALYFDRVIPFVFSPTPNEILPDVLINESEYWKTWGLARAKHFCVGLFRGVGYEEVLAIDKQTLNSIIEYGDGSLKNINILNNALSRAYIEHIDIIHRMIINIVEGHTFLHGVPVLTLSDDLTGVGATADDITIALAQLDLVDVSSAPWEQIIEFRKDAVAQTQFRRLRLFMNEELRNKSRSYIEDKIHVMLDDYRMAAKSHGFELTQGVLTQICNSKSLVATAGAVLAAAIVGSPLGAGVAAMAGTIVEIANIALLFANKKHEFNKVATDHNLAYIIEAKRRFEPADV